MGSQYQRLVQLVEYFRGVSKRESTMANSVISPVNANLNFRRGVIICTAN